MCTCDVKTTLEICGVQHTAWISFYSYQVNVFASGIRKAMNKESKYKADCDNDKCDEHAEFKPPTSLVQGLVELDEDDAVGDQGDEDQADHGKTPGFKSCQTFRYQRDMISCQRQGH